MKNIFALVAIVALLTSCVDEISMDYNTIDPIPVIEAIADQDGTLVCLSQTRNMDSAPTVSDMSSADIVLTVDGTKSYTFVYLGSGKYFAPYVPQTTDSICHLSVMLDGQTYENTSVITTPPVITDSKLLWEPLWDTRMAMYRLYVLSPSDEVQYYLYRAYRNNKGYQWGTFTNKGSRDGYSEKNILLFAEDALDDPEEYKDDIFFDGDTLSVSVTSIDRQTYDYFESLSLSSRSSANPYCFFSGGALGYFAVEMPAWQSSLVFRLEDVVSSE